MNRLKADLLLLLGALIWGTAFIAQKYANDSMGPVSFVGARFLVSTLALLPFMYYEAKKNRTPLKSKDWCIAAIIGLCLFAASGLQQIGLLTTSATHGGFLTALYVVLVPCVVWCLTQKRPTIAVGIACIISVNGAWLLAGKGQAQSWGGGDRLVILSDIGWAIGIALVPAFLSRAQRPFLLCFVQYGITAILGLAIGAATETVTMRGIMLALPSILYAGLLSGGVAYTLQIIAQKHTPAAEAALIMSLESVFAALAGAILLGERLTVLAAIGCALILLGVLIVELGPMLLRNIKMIIAGSDIALQENEND